MSEKFSEDRDIVCLELARKAKELVEGMQTRVGRNPDIADFVAAFTPTIKNYEPDELDRWLERRRNG
jgi:hypothetical protein